MNTVNIIVTCTHTDNLKTSALHIERTHNQTRPQTATFFRNHTQHNHPTQHNHSTQHSHRKRNRERERGEKPQQGGKRERERERERERGETHTHTHTHTHTPTPNPPPPPTLFLIWQSLHCWKLLKLGDHLPTTTTTTTTRRASCAAPFAQTNKNTNAPMPPPVTLHVAEQVAQARSHRMCISECSDAPQRATSQSTLRSPIRTG